MPTFVNGAAAGHAYAAMAPQSDETEFLVSRAEIRIHHIDLLVNAGVTQQDFTLSRPVQSLDRAFIRSVSNTYVTSPLASVGAILGPNNLGVIAELIDEATIRCYRPSGTTYATAYRGEVWEYKGPANGVNAFEVIDFQRVTLDDGDTNDGFSYTVPGGSRMVPVLSGFNSSHSGQEWERIYVRASAGGSAAGINREDTDGAVTWGLAAVRFTGSAWVLDSHFDPTQSDGLNFGQIAAAVKLMFTSGSCGVNSGEHAQVAYRLHDRGIGLIGRQHNTSANSPYGIRDHYMLENANIERKRSIGSQGHIGSGTSIAFVNAGNLAQPANPEAPEDSSINSASMFAFFSTNGASLRRFPEPGWYGEVLLDEGCIKMIGARSRTGSSSEVTAHGIKLPQFDSESIGGMALGYGAAHGRAEGKLPAELAIPHDVTQASGNEAPVASGQEAVVASGNQATVKSGIIAAVPEATNQAVVDDDNEANIVEV